MQTFYRLLSYLKPYWKQVVVGTVCLVAAVPLQLFHPLVWMFIVDDVLLAENLDPGQKKQLLIMWIGIMVAVHFLGVLLQTIRTYVLGVVGKQYLFDLRTDLYSKLQDHSLSFFHHHESGDVIARTIGDVETVQDVAVNGVDNVIVSFLQFILVAGIILVLDWRVGALTLIPMFLVAVAVWLFNTRIKGLYRRIRDCLGDISAKLQENLVGMIVIKAFARELYEMTRFEEANRKYLKEGIKGVGARTIYFPAVFTLAFLSGVIMLGVGSWFIIDGDNFTVGKLVAYRGYWWYLFAPVMALAQTNETIQQAIAAASRFFELYDEPVEITDTDDAIVLTTVDGGITCDAVNFTYPERDPVLIDVSFNLESGDKLGIAGPSGAGKSTLLYLLLRFYDPQNGRILLDGHDLRSLRQGDIRRHIAIVTQEPILFNQSVHNNILYGRLDASEEEIIEASKQANAHEFIDLLPNKYSTLVGERGVKLSGGQKQRICIARAFLANTPVLLLDEATAAVEPESEAIIQAALERLMHGRTTVIVSHRLSMMRDADRIVVLNHGRVSEHGTHQQLLERDEWYARMYHLQMGKKT